MKKKKCLKKLMVISHERSGTHFLMNALSLNSQYTAKPWWNFDLEKGINYYSEVEIYNYFKKYKGKYINNILKSHHSVDFFRNNLDYLTSEYYIVYIYRNPIDVMISFKLHLDTFTWDTGPKTQTLHEFIVSEPKGWILRYQKQQFKNLLERWDFHVNGWFDISKTYPIKLVSYEDLNNNYQKTMLDLLEYINILPPKDIIRPTKSENTITPSSEKEKQVLKKEIIDCTNKTNIFCSKGLKKCGYIK